MSEQRDSIILSNWLLKRSKKSHSWQRKWFVLRRNQLAYYKDSKEYKASKVIPLLDILSFSEIPDGQKWHFIVVTSKRVFHLKALDQESYQQWCKAMEEMMKDKDEVLKDVNDDDDVNYEDQDEDDEDDEDDDEEEDEDNMLMPPPPPPPPQLQPPFGSQEDIVHQDFQSTMLHNNFSGTDDNFTSGGMSEAEGKQQHIPPLSRSANNSTVSLHHFKERDLPTPIKEENENEHELESGREEEEEQQQQKQKTQQKKKERTVYFNSFSSSSPEHEIDRGSLYRLKNKRYNQWKKYYITLTNHFLYFYKNSREYEQGKEYKKIDLDQIIDCVELDPLSRSRVYCMLIVTAKKRLRFCADSEEELTKWLVLLKTIVKTRKNEKAN